MGASRRSTGLIAGAAQIQMDKSIAASDKGPNECDLKDPRAPACDCCLGECGQGRRL
jgi:hypothetical protein